MTEWADEDSVRDAMQKWTAGQIECRSFGHNWRSRTVTHRPGVYTITQRCSRCRNERVREIDEQGRTISAWRFHYAEGYLLQGVGRIGDDARSVLRLDSILKHGVIEEENDE